MGILSWLFGSGNPPSIPAQPVPPLSQYPTAADAQNAQRVDNWYGQPVAPYAAGQTAQVYGWDGAPQSSVGGDVIEALSAANSMHIEPNERLGLGDYFGRAALAANRIPVAALGFDPRRITTDIVTDPKTVNIQGLFSPANDRIFTVHGEDPDSASTPVHESIHRGLQELRLARKMPEGDYGDEEHLVREIMRRMGGDPEQNPTSLQMKSENDARGLLPDDFIKAINVAASGEIARRTPRGPR